MTTTEIAADSIVSAIPCHGITRIE